jgi:hypothetical protein
MILFVKRGPVRMCVFLLLLLSGGVIVNIAVAWACAAWSPRGHIVGRTERAYSHPGGERWIVSLLSPTFGMTWVSGVPANSIWAPADQGYVGSDFIPKWSRTRQRPPRAEFDDPDGSWTYEIATGWPARSGIALVRKTTKLRQFQPISGISVLDDGSGEPLSYRMLPVQPIWRGFAINTVFYAGVLWLVFAAPFAVRRRRRIKRGLCPECAYPVGSSDVCTECGAIVVRKRVSA